MRVNFPVPMSKPFPRSLTPHYKGVLPYMNTSDVFNTIYNQNRKRIHYHIHALNIRDSDLEWLQIGSIALWQAYRQYEPDKGPMSTYFNYMIRNRLIDHVRKSSCQARDIASNIENSPIPTITHQHASARSLDDLIYSSFTTNHYLLDFIQTRLTYNQWRWFQDSIINNQTTREIADHNQTSTDAVKSWRRQARKKLNTPEIRDIILPDIS